MKALSVSQWFHLSKILCMKKATNTNEHHHLGENAKVALYAAGFLTLVMALSYLYWFA